MRQHVLRAAAAVASLAALLTLVACGPSPGVPRAAGSDAPRRPIVVGSKIDGEGLLLGQMILAVLRDKGYAVEDKTRTGATDVVRKALLAGQIDVYPEYTANGILVFNKDIATDPAVLRDATKTYARARELDAPNGVVWLKAAPANNTWAVAVPRAFSQANSVTTLADWAAYIASGKPVKVVGSQEFFTSPVAMPAFEKAYGFKLGPDRIVALATGDTAVSEKAAAEGTDGANAGMAYGTDGAIAALDLVVLSDPKGAQPIYQPAPTVRRAAADAYPELGSMLDPVFERLTLETLQTLNGRVSVEGKDARTVATDWLRAEGLIR